MEVRIRQITPAVPILTIRKRVAAYARVSSEKMSMVESLSAQVSYYSAYIQRHPEWEYAGVYADEGFTGTTTDRPEFRRLLEDCRAGRIDIVLTKSVSRFARNTLTLLGITRELKELGIDVFFEKENMHSTSGDGELLLSILASYAQEESRSVSENCKWRIRKKFENGIPMSTLLLGYKIQHGDFEIIPEEAEIVRMIFNDYLSGMGCNAIQRKLTALGIKTKLDGVWNVARINDILRNEKYAGDLLLQKVFRIDHVAKKDRVNHGELPRFYVRDHHTAIIDRASFERVQEIMRLRAAYYHPHACQYTTYPFTGKIICDNCGKAYRRKTTNGKIGWQCGTFLTLGKEYCHAKQTPEDTLMAVTASVLGLKTFDAAAFADRIKEIHVPAFNHLVYVFHDGTEIERVWQDKSRRESWTPEMRQQASAHAYRRYAK